ncbi:MAG: 4-hydroxy-3-methylbut-2-enyl diphosphate reductase [Verrucomicrobia bacterium]|nr:4-hydroxy-3-methylbut-2-enyl diphosphate reductase [Verrucomicrobiota bacterium]
MARVQEQVEHHYHSSLVERVRADGSVLIAGKTTLRLAKQFGFCYGVERAIDLAYAARKVFPDARLFLIGEIIHNPEVNAQIAALGIRNLLDESGRPHVEDLGPEDVVIVPAFGTTVPLVEEIKSHGCRIVDTTCGDVMSVWKRVRQNATEEVTSIIHGKASHEETRATASRALGNGNGRYLIVLNLEETDRVCDYILGKVSREEFLCEFKERFSEGFDPDLHLQRIGVANQTTMLREETEAVQRKLKEAITLRDGSDKNFRLFDTICGATQERQDALKELLLQPLDLLLVVGGYNSSNTTHLAEMGEQSVPTYFIRNQECLENANMIRHFDLHQKKEISSEVSWLPQVGSNARIGITAGASCPNNLIEEVMLRVLSLRGETLPSA